MYVARFSLKVLVISALITSVAGPAGVGAHDFSHLRRNAIVLGWAGWEIEESLEIKVHKPRKSRKKAKASQPTVPPGAEHPATACSALLEYAGKVQTLMYAADPRPLLRDLRLAHIRLQAALRKNNRPPVEQEDIRKYTKMVDAEFSVATQPAAIPAVADASQSDALSELYKYLMQKLTPEEPEQLSREVLSALLDYAKQANEAMASTGTKDWAKTLQLAHIKVQTVLRRNGRADDLGKEIQKRTSAAVGAISVTTATSVPKPSESLKLLDQKLKDLLKDQKCVETAGSTSVDTAVPSNTR